MSIDQERYRKFQSELEGFLSRISLEERMRVIESKLTDWLARQDLDARDLSELERHLRNLLDDDLDPLVKKITSSFDDTLDLVNDLYDDIGDDVGRAFQRVRAVEKVSNSQIGQYKESTLQDIKRRVRKGLRAGEGVDKLRDRISKAGGKAAHYADTIAKTQVKSYGRASKAEKARIGEVEYFEYVGVVRNTTRPFCRAMVGSTHHVKRIREMRNGNLEPVIQHCGGWNCIHDWEPDPFANHEDQAEGDARELEEGDSTVVLFGTESEVEEYDRAKELNRDARD